MDKKANWKAVQVYADCPHCDGNLVEPLTGAFLITVEATHSDSEFRCHECGKYSRLRLSAYKECKA